MTLQVLVASMMQADTSLYKRMNLQCSTVIANQCNEWGYCEKMHEFGKVCMISSATRGVGINRNMAITLSDADILLFADDDIEYYDGELAGIKEAFEKLPQADVILFGMDMTKGGEVYERRRDTLKRRRIWNSMRYGTYRIAIRRSSLRRHNLWFSPLFGGGCIYGSGEDTLFLRECFRAGLKVYSYPYTLGRCAKDSSTWFSGFNEKFMFDKGAWLACAFPKAKHIIKWYFIHKFAKETDLTFRDMVGYINDGIRAFPELKTYGERKGE